MDDRGFGVQFLVDPRDFIFSITSRPALGPTQPPIRWVPEAVFPGLKPQEREADHSPHLVPSLRMVELYLHSPVCLQSRRISQAAGKKQATSSRHMLSRWFLAQLIFRSWRWRGYIPPKLRFTLNGLHGIISRKMVLFTKLLFLVAVIINVRPSLGMHQHYECLKSGYYYWTSDSRNILTDHCNRI
jgi:hypothetical protein